MISAIFACKIREAIISLNWTGCSSQMLTEQSRCRERDTCALISCCCSSTNDHRDSLKFVQEVAIFVNSHFFVSTQSLLLTFSLSDYTISDWFRPRYGPNVCLLLNHRETFRVAGYFFFSRTTGRTSATSDLRSNVQPNWSHSRALDTLVHHRDWQYVQELFVSAECIVFP